FLSLFLSFSSYFFFLIIRPPPSSTLFPYTTLFRSVGIRFKGAEKTNVEEYCISEGWIRVAAGTAKDRHGNPLTIKVHGPVEPALDRKSTRLNSSHSQNSYAVFCLKKKTTLILVLAH